MQRHGNPHLREAEYVRATALLQRTLLYDHLPYADVKKCRAERAALVEIHRRGGGPAEDTPEASTAAWAARLQTPETAADNPRQAIIDAGLKLLGKKKEDFGAKWNDPQFVDNFFNASMKHAETLDPTLTTAAGLPGYLKVLEAAVAQKEQAEADARREAAEAIRRLRMKTGQERPLAN